MQQGNLLSDTLEITYKKDFHIQNGIYAQWLKYRWIHVAATVRITDLCDIMSDKNKLPFSHQKFQIIISNIIAPIHTSARMWFFNCTIRRKIKLTHLGKCWHDFSACVCVLAFYADAALGFYFYFSVLKPFIITMGY